MNLAVHTEGDGTPVLLVHGFPDSSRVWRNQLRPLVESGRRVIVPDLRGMGNSDRPEGVDAYRGMVVVAPSMTPSEASASISFTLPLSTKSFMVCLL